jgi:decaprenylphospho-beta-D-erythro-pentofuranosid-2-ulose 2-reductase
MIDANGYPQSVLVVGGGSEIGAAIVEKLVSKRCDQVILAGPNATSLEKVQLRLQSISAARVDLINLDLLDLDALAPFVTGVFQRYGTIDCIIIAAGQLGEQSNDEVDPERVREITTINYLGPAMLMTAATQALRVQGYGFFIVLSSVAGERVRRSNSLYGAAKAALDGFSLSLGDALREFGISVLVVRPGFVRSKMTAGLKAAPLSTTPEGVADDVIKAIETQKELIWSPLPLRVVLSIYRHLPRSLARRVPM